MLGFAFAISISLLCLSALPLSLAAPEVAAVQLADICAAFPESSRGPNASEPLFLQLTHSGNGSIESAYASGRYSFAHTGVMISGNITFATDNSVAPAPVQCYDNKIHVLIALGRDPATGVYQNDWWNLTIFTYPGNSLLTYAIRDVVDAIPYKVSIDGVIQEGIYLGGPDQRVTWALQYRPAEPGFSRPYFSVRLFESGGALEEDEFAGLIKITK